MTAQAGFGLVEALVALGILGLASVALIGAAQTHLTRIDGLERRAVALWLAESHLAELGLAPPTEGAVAVQAMARDWVIETRIEATADPDLARVDIAVRLATDPSPSARLDGFVDLRRGAR